MIRVIGIVIALGLGLALHPATESMARADGYAIDPELVKQLARGVVDRARRAIAIGPFAGGFGGAALSPNRGVGGVSFGLGLYTFDVPNALQAREIVRAKLETRVRERVAQIVAGGAAVTDVEAIAREVANDVVKEIAGELPPPRMLERPGIAVVLEGVALLEPGGWQARLGASYGLRVASLGFGAGVQRSGGETSLFAGAEASVRLTPTGMARTPVFDVFARFDLHFDDGQRTGVLLGGVRALLDLI